MYYGVLRMPIQNKDGYGDDVLTTTCGNYHVRAEYIWGLLLILVANRL
jgi:hypothetical protein